MQKEKIKLFSTFTGIGSPEMALRNIGVDFEVVGISEVDKWALQAYDAIHCEDIPEPEYPSKEEMKEIFTKYNIAYNFSTGKSEMPRNEKDLRRLYKAHVNSKNYGDIRLIDETKMPEFNFFTYSFPCFVAGTPVLTSTGFKAIETIEKGELVMTHNNHFKPVVAPMKQMADHLYEVDTMCTTTLEVTEEHPFYVRKRHNHFKRKTVNGERKGYRTRTFDKPEWVNTKDLNKDYYVASPINTEAKLPEWKGSDFTWSDNRKTRHSNKLQEKFTTEEFWWIIGRYMGDGWTRTQGGIIICGANHEIKDITPKLDILGFNYNVVITGTSCDKIHIPFKEIGEYVGQFGKGASTKKLTGDILNLPKHLLKAFLDGYVSADGSYTKGYYRASSVSAELTYGIGQCVAKVYNRPFSIHKSEKPATCVIEGRTVNQKPAYIISWKLESNKQDQAFCEDGYIWSPIRRVEKKAYVGMVYNFEVADDNSYVVQNVIVHNCKNISVAGRQAGLEEGSETQSSLLWECRRILAYSKPKYLMMENVKNLAGKKFKPLLDLWISTLNELGYTSNYAILNGKDFGVPQNRERVIMISVLDSEEDYIFPDKRPLDICLRDILDTEVPENYYIDESKYKHITEDLPSQEISYCIDANYHKGISVEQYIKKRRRQLVQVRNLSNKTHANTRIYSDEGLCPTLNSMNGGNRQPKVLLTDGCAIRGRRNKEGIIEQTLEINKHDSLSNSITTVSKDSLVLEKAFIIDDTMGFCKDKEGNKKPRVYEDYAPSLRGTRSGLKTIDSKMRVRKLTPIECWRLMGYTDEDFHKASKDGKLANTKLYERAGRGIVVPMLEDVFKKLFKN